RVCVVWVGVGGCERERVRPCETLTLDEKTPNVYQVISCVFIALWCWPLVLLVCFHCPLVLAAGITLTTVSSRPFRSCLACSRRSCINLHTHTHTPTHTTTTHT